MLVSWVSTTQNNIFFLIFFFSFLAGVLLIRTFNNVEKKHVDLKSFLQIVSKIDDENKNSRRRGANSEPKSPRCCKYMKIVSKGPVRKMYPSVVGTYENMKEDHESPVYKHVSKKRYIARPEGVTITNTPTYTWGVNSKEGATWGWIKALESQPCPHMVNYWGVFKSEKKRWVRDQTLEIKCSTKFGE